MSDDSLALRAQKLHHDGHYAQEIEVLRSVLARQKHRLGSTDPAVIQLVVDLADANFEQGQYKEAERLYRRSLAVREQTLGPSHALVAQSLNKLGRLLYKLFRYTEAEPLLRRAIAILDQEGRESSELADCLASLGAGLVDQGRVNEGVPLLNRAIAIHERVSGAGDASLASDMLALFVAKQKLADYDGGLELTSRAVEELESALGPSHPHVAEGLLLLAAAKLELEQIAEAEPILERALKMSRETLGPDHPQVGLCLQVLGWLRLSQGRYADALNAYQGALNIAKKTVGRWNVRVSDALIELSYIYMKLAKFELAESTGLEALEIVNKTLPKDSMAKMSVYNNIGSIYKVIGKYSAAIQMLKEAERIYETTANADSPVHPRIFSNIIDLYIIQGHYNQAYSLLQIVIKLFENNIGEDKDNIQLSYYLSKLADIYEELGDFETAEPIRVRSLTNLEKNLPANHPDIAGQIDRLAELYRKEGRYAEADPLYQRAIKMYEANGGPDHPDVAKVLIHMAESFRAQGRFGEAFPLYQRGLTIQEKAYGKDDSRVAQSLAGLAGLLSSESRYVDARPLLQRAIQIQEKVLDSDHPDLAANLSKLAQADRQLGEPDRALLESGRAGTILEKRLLADSANVSDASQIWENTVRWQFLLEISLLYESSAVKATSEGFRLAQLAHSSSAARALAEMASRLVPESGSVSALLREQQDLALRRKDLDAAVMKAIDRPLAERDPAQEKILRADFEAASASLAALDTKIARDLPDYAGLVQPRAAALEDSQRLLGSDEAMLVYLVGDKESWLWAVRHDRAQLFRLELTAGELATAVSKLRGRLDPFQNPKLKPYDAHRAFLLYEKLIDPARDVLKGAHQLIIVPDATLANFPFQVLVTQDPMRAPQTLADHRSIAWFARDYALTTLPSVSSLSFLRRISKRDPAPKVYAGFGNPVLGGTQTPPPDKFLARILRGGSAALRELRQLPALPETEEEIKSVSAALGAKDSDIYLGPRATEPNLKAAHLADYRIIHFATHGLTAGELSGLAEPALVLTPPNEISEDNDGLLTASKVATLRLNADWVILSACNTAKTDDRADAGGLSGLARAFFYAGARSLLVSNWAVSSDAAARLTIRTVKELQEHPGIGRAEALRRAEMSMLDETAPPEFAHPLAWAPFVLAGDGSAGR